MPYTRIHHNVTTLTPNGIRFAKGEDSELTRYQRMKKHSHQFTIRLSHVDREELWERAKKQNVPVAELIRTYIQWGLDNE